MTPGTVLFDAQFRFSDGTLGQKILVLLNDGTDGVYVVIKTTSKDKHKRRKFGCQTSDRYPNFYVPSGKCCLRGESWLMLDQFFEFHRQDLLTKRFAGQLNPLGVLPDIVLTVRGSEIQFLGLPGPTWKRPSLRVPTVLRCIFASLTAASDANEFLRRW